MLHRLKEFFKVASDNKVRMRVVSGDLECDLSETAVAQAYERVSLAETKEQILDVQGIFRGATLDTWRFDFRADKGENITGHLADEVTEEEAVAMIHLTESPCVATLRQTLVTTRSGTLRTRYELTALKQVAAK